MRHQFKSFLPILFHFYLAHTTFGSNDGIDEITSLKHNLISCKTSIDKINILNKLSNRYSETNLDSSIYYAHRALILARQINNSDLIADSYYSLGNSFKSMGKLDSAGFYLFGALDLYKDSEKKIITTIAIGEYYRANSELRKASIYINRAINDCRKTKKIKNLPHAFNRQGAVYFELSVNNAVLEGIFPDTLQKAIELVDSSFYWSEKLNIDKYDVSNYNILGACYQKLKDYNKAIYYLNLALQEAKKNNKIIEMPMIYRNISLNYLETSQFDLAKKMAMTGAAMADSLKINSSLAFNYYALMLIGEAMHDDKLSLEFLHKKDSIEYLINSEIAITKAKELEEKYKNKEKELLIEKQNSKLAKKQKQSITMMLWLVFLIVVLFGALLFTFRIRKTNKLLGSKNKEIELSSKELAKLSQFKNDLMGMIVHDLKNPLNTIINFSKMSNQKENIDFEKQKESNRNIESSALNMLNIVNNIIDLQKFEEAKMNLALAENSINTIIDVAVKNVRLLLLQKNITINNLIRVTNISQYDRDLIERVIINLLTNAIKFSPNNETITIESDQSGAYVKIKITDKGPGIAPDKIPLLFKKFARAEIRSMGMSTSSGLGLAFAKCAIQAHGGEVGVNSELGKGACFWFTLKTESSIQQIKTTQVKNEERETRYSSEFLKDILPLKKTLAGFQFYETSEILNNIKNFKCKHPEYKEWKDQIENAVLYSNKYKYIELISANE